MKKMIIIIVTAIVGCGIGLFIGINFGRDNVSQNISTIQVNNGEYALKGGWGTNLKVQDDMWTIEKNTYRIVYASDDNIVLIGDKNNLIYKVKQDGDKFNLYKVTKKGTAKNSVVTLEKNK